MGELLIPLLIMAVVGAMIAIGAIAGLYAEKKRREAVQAVADDLGLAFYRDGDSRLVDQLADLQLFSKGRSRRIANMIQGETEEVVMGIFDYRYTTGSGKKSHTYRQSVVFFRAMDLSLPHFEMRPQGFFHGIGKIFGYQDIDFESHPRFSKTFVLRGTNDELVRATFDGKLLSALEQKPGICLEGRGTDLIFYRHGKRAKPHQLRELMQEGFDVLAMFRAG